MLQFQEFRPLSLALAEKIWRIRWYDDHGDVDDKKDDDDDDDNDKASEIRWVGGMCISNAPH